MNDTELYGGSTDNMTLADMRLGIHFRVLCPTCRGDYPEGRVSRLAYGRVQIADSNCPNCNGK